MPTTRAQRSGGRRKFASAGAGVLGGTNNNTVAQSGGTNQSTCQVPLD